MLHGSYCSSGYLLLARFGRPIKDHLTPKFPSPRWFHISAANGLLPSASRRPNENRQLGAGLKGRNTAVYRKYTPDTHQTAPRLGWEICRGAAVLVAADPVMMAGQSAIGPVVSLKDERFTLN